MGHLQDGRNSSHFFEGKLDDGTRFVDSKGFIEKYQADIQDEFMLGYLIHLISDDIWMKFIYFRDAFNNHTYSDP